MSNDAPSPQTLVDIFIGSCGAAFGKYAAELRERMRESMAALLAAGASEPAALAELLKGNEERLVEAERRVLGDAKAVKARVEEQARMIEALLASNELLREQLAEVRDQNRKLREQAKATT